MFEEKEVLIKRLVEKRKQQIRAGLETEEQEDVRREEMRSEYAEHIAQYVDYIKGILGEGTTMDPNESFDSTGH